METATAELHDLQRRLQTDGWCVIEDVIPSDKVDEVRASILATLEQHQQADARNHVGKISGLINYDQSIAPYLAEPRLLALCQALLGQHVRISFTTCMTLFPSDKRGQWHADWPFNQQNAGHIPAPYPDMVAHLTTIWMLSPFSPETGATLVVSGSHRSNDNPTGNIDIDLFAPYPSEMFISGAAGSVLVMDSRLWHAMSPNRSAEPRVGLAIRYAPWWLNLNVLLPDSDERRRLVDEAGGQDNITPPVPAEVFAGLPEETKPLYAHWMKNT